uniref:Uncharacterized protein n=1 Tax=viral metagenome TaxID=1070528 RepID=A0A6M3K613_9ZZZZ
MHLLRTQWKDNVLYILQENESVAKECPFREIACSSYCAHFLLEFHPALYLRPSHSGSSTLEEKEGSASIKLLCANGYELRGLGVKDGTKESKLA